MRAMFFVLAIGALASGCLRNKFDLCAQEPPDPNCAYLDATNDAGFDAGAAPVDASTMDASTAD